MRSSSRAPWVRPSCSTIRAPTPRPGAGRGRGHQPCGDRRARHGHSGRRPGRRASWRLPKTAMRSSSMATMARCICARRRTLQRAYEEKVRFRARRQEQFRALRAVEPVTQGRQAHQPQHECRPAGRPAAARRIRRRGHRPVPHRTAVHDRLDHAEGGGAGSLLPQRHQAGGRRSRSPSARSISAATRSCPISARPRKKTRRSAGVRSAWRSTGRACCAPSFGRC